MNISAHCQHRMATRSFPAKYAEILHAHGDYTEQKGGSYVLSLSEQDVNEIKECLAAEECELLHRLKLKRLKLKKSGLKLVSSEIEIKTNESCEIAQIRHEAKKLKRLRNRLKPGYGVFTYSENSENVVAITVGCVTKRIKGYRLTK